MKITKCYALTGIPSHSSNSVSSSLAGRSWEGRYSRGVDLQAVDSGMCLCQKPCSSTATWRSGLQIFVLNGAVHFLICNSLCCYHANSDRVEAT